MKCTLFRATAIGSLGALLAAPVWMTAQAQPSQQGGTQPFQSIDRDGDGYVSASEARQQGIDPARFSRSDSDQDQRLSRSEYESLNGQSDGSSQAQAGAQDEITVQEQQGEIIVERSAPDVTVRQQPPDVTVVQPQPQVDVQQPQTAQAPTDSAGKPPKVYYRAPGSQTGQPETQVSFQQLDQDSSGALDSSELQQHPQLSAQWQQYDQDDSGELEQSEFSAFQSEQGGMPSSQQQAGQMSFEQLDKDSSGTLDSSELQQHPQLSAQWQQYDQDNSGQIDRSEFSAFEAQQTGQAGQSQEQPAATAVVGNSLEAKTPEELRGLTVNDQDGNRLGKVQKIVRSPQDNTLHAVIASGGFLGMGESRFALEIDKLSMQDGQLVADTRQTRDELEQAYNRDEYQDLEQTDVQLGQLQQQAGASEQVSFQQLDQDSSGALTPDEMQQHPQLSAQWQQYDEDNSGQLEQAEFSAFQAAQESGQ